MSTNPVNTEAASELLQIIEGMRRHMKEFLEGEESTYTRQNARLRIEVYDQVLEQLEAHLPGIEVDAVMAAAPGTTPEQAALLLAAAAMGREAPLAAAAA